jgi:hypothetical protein
MPTKLNISNDDQHKKALVRLEKMMLNKIKFTEKEMNDLVNAIVLYEEKRWPILYDGKE